MRLPFGLGRRSASGNGATGGSSGTAASAAAAGGADGSAAGASPRSRAWADLPPIQRTAGAMPLVAAPGRFADGLPGTQELPPIVQPLGHEVSPLATPGLVVAHARAVPATPKGGSLPPVQRRASRSGRTSDTVERSAASGDVAEPEDAVAAGAVAAESPADEPPVQTVRRLPTVSRMTIRMPDRPLTSAASAAAPASAQRTTADRGPSGRPSGGPAGMRRSSTPLPAAARPTVSREPARGDSVTSGRDAHPDAATSARSGLGAPMDELPLAVRPVGRPDAAVSPSSTISRPVAGPMPLTAARPATAQRETMEVEGHPAEARRAGEPGGTAAEIERPLPALPILPVARSTRADPPAATAAQPSHIAAPKPAPSTRPILAARPIEPAVRVQRSVAPRADDALPDELPSPWWRPPQNPAPTAMAAASLASESAPVSVSRSIPSQHRMDSALPEEGGSVRSSTSQRFPVHQARASQALQRAPGAAASSLPLPRPAAPVGSDHASRAARATATSAPSAEPQRLITAGSPAQPVVQTSRAGASSSPAHADVGGASAGPVVQRIDGAAPDPTADSRSARRTELELDELARDLFGRIRGRLRNELIYDREAKGLTFDNV